MKKAAGLSETSLNIKQTKWPQTAGDKQQFRKKYELNLKQQTVKILMCDRHLRCVVTKLNTDWETSINTTNYLL